VGVVKNEEVAVLFDRLGGGDVCRVNRSERVVRKHRDLNQSNLRQQPLSSN
jgi:hypothetical protein